MRGTWFFLLVAVTASAPSFANDAAPAEESLAAQIAAAKDDFKPISKDRVAELRRRVHARLANLRALLARKPADEAKEWRGRLKWDVLEEELAKDAPALNRLNTSLLSFRDDFAGLETDDFTELRDSLNRYMNGVLFSAAETQAAYQKRLDDLASDLAAYEAAPSTDGAVAVARHLGWLERAEQVPQLVGAVRQRLSHPNLVAQVSERFVTAAVADQVERTQRVNECILGTAIHGTATLRGTLAAELVPNAERGQVALHLEGNIGSSNVGYNGPVTVNTSGHTTVSGTKDVYLEPFSFFADYASVYCTTSTTIHSICAKSKLVRKIAWKRASSQKAQAERLASGKAATRVAGQMNQQASEMLADAEGKYREQLLHPLIRRESVPRQFDFATTDDLLRVTLLHATAMQLGAPAAAPALDGGHDLSLRVHESFIGNMAESMLGRYTLTDAKVVEAYQKAGRELPRDLASDEEPEWSITFAADQPVIVRIRDGELDVKLRATRFTRGEQTITHAIELAASYKFEPFEGRLKFTRLADVSATFVGRESLSAQETALKSILATKFGSVFNETVVTEGLKLPERLARAGTLAIQKVESGSGWMRLGWQLTPPSAAASAAATADNQAEAADQSLSEKGADPLETAHFSRHTGAAGEGRTPFRTGS